MSVHYVAQPRSNPKNPEASPKYYVVSKSIKPINREYLVDDMVRNTSLTEDEASAGINYLFKAIPRLLELGFTVQLGKLGYFRISFKSKSSDTKEAATPDKITRKKLVFICGKEIRERVSSFQVEKFPEI
jgi:predicted histone-like DNA-binding protein